MANKLYTDFLPAVPVAPADILLQADPSTGALSAVVISDLQSMDPTIGMIRGMGSGVIAAPPYDWIEGGNNPFTMNSQQVLGTGMYLSIRSSITALCFIQKVQGNYTANNNNKLAIYHISGSNISRVAQTANTGTIWKGAANSFQIIPLTASITLDRGFYYVAGLWCSSATVTAPGIGRTAASFYNTTSWLDCPSSILPSIQLTSNTDLNSSYAYSTLLTQNTPATFMMYGSPV